MTEPFFILSTVRTRSAWVANLLTTDTSWCGHDVIHHAGRRFDPPAGYERVGAIGSDVAMYADDLARDFPNARFAVLMRHPTDVVKSARRLGFPVDTQRVRKLHDRIMAFAEEHGCRVFQFDNLAKPPLQALWEICLPGVAWSDARVELLDGFNIQARPGQTQ